MRRDAEICFSCDLACGFERSRIRRRRDVAVQQSPTQATQREIPIRADAAMARASSKSERAFQFGRKRLIYFAEWIVHHQSSRRSRHAPENFEREEQLRARRLLREVAKGRSESDRS